MKPKAKVKIAVDVLMTLGMLFLMGYQFWGDVAHEWAGAGMFVLFILHHALNGGWYKSLFRGKYTPFRVFQIVVDALVLLDMLGLMVSEVILSNHVFDFLPILGGMGFARTLHMLASFWGFLLMALHLGLHWNVFLGMARKAPAFQKPSRRRTIVLNLLGHLGVGRLDALPGQLQGIGPHTAGPLVFPVKGAGGDGGVVRPDEHRLNAGRAQLNAANGLALPDGLLNLFQFHHKG